MSGDVSAAILDQLRALARAEQVTILYACESGSRAWGFASTDSDYDVRFIYHRPIAAYLSLSPPPHTLERPVDHDIDLSGWDLFKACQLLRKSNPPLMEWLGSPIQYLEVGDLAATLRKLGGEYFSIRACGEHYRSMAKKNYEAYIRNRDHVTHKKYLYAVRPLLCARWLLKHETFPPTAFAEVMAEAPAPRRVLDELERLIEAKLAEPERKLGPRIAVFDQFIARELDRLADELAVMPGRRFPVELLDELIRRTLGL